LHLYEIWNQFVIGMRATSPLEYIGVLTGIISVWYSRKEHILVYPIGLISTIIYIYLSAKQHLLGEATVNLYYTIMSFVGWYMWAKKDKTDNPVLHISKASKKEWIEHLAFFGVFYIAIFCALIYFKNSFGGVIPWADAFASATAFTGMWLMTKKKFESWYWWIATNIASIPLYFIKGYVFSSVYYVILLFMAFWGLAEWSKKIKTHKNQDNV